MSKQDELHAMRHSLAHIMATAVTTLWPEARLGVGPVVDDGFYYDIDIPGVTISGDDFKKIEKEMRKVINQKQPFVKTMKPMLDALEWAKSNKQPYKQELLNDLRREGTTLASELDAAMMGMDLPAAVSGMSAPKVEVGEVSFYTNGSFTDLCRGPHVEDTGKVGAFKLMRVAGAYWRGNEKNPQMQRLYGVAFATQEELDAHLQMLEEAKKRDHRKVGAELKLFTTSPLVGKGLPLLLERGATIRRTLERFIVEEEIRRGYTHVITPDLASLELYKTSGHYPYYKDSMYAPIKIDEDEFMLRPMTCPHHFQIYQDEPRSYKNLPMRIAELAKLYRYEQSGELSGLMRVRSFTLADAHIVCTPEQARSEVEGVLDLIEYTCTQLGLVKEKDYTYRLSLGDRNDEKKYFKDDAAWDQAEDVLRGALKDRKEPFYEAEAEAAFYGPKIDIQMKNVLGKEDTAFTVQYDFVMPKRFELRYVDEDGAEKEPVVIHRSSIGAMERIMAFLIEHTAGHFPFWLAPEQVRILTINDSVKDYCEEIQAVLNDIVLMKPLKFNELRHTIDGRSESLGKKIREAAKQKIPVMLIVGERDKADKTVNVRTSEGETTMPINELKDCLEKVK